MHTLVVRCIEETEISGVRFEPGDLLAIPAGDPIPKDFEGHWWASTQKAEIDLGDDGRAVFRMDGEKVDAITPTLLEKATRLHTPEHEKWPAYKTAFISGTPSLLERLDTILSLEPGAEVNTSLLGMPGTEALVVNEYANWRDIGGAPEGFWLWFRKTFSGLFDGDPNSGSKPRKASNSRERWTDDLEQGMLEFLMRRKRRKPYPKEALDGLKEQRPDLFEGMSVSDFGSVYETYKKHHHRRLWEESRKMNGGTSPR